MRSGGQKLNELVEPSIEKERVNEPDDLSTIVRYIERIDSKTGKIVFDERPFSNIPVGARFILRYPCLIISRINAKIGCVAILPKELDGILATGEYYSLKPKHGIDIDFLHEILRSNVAKQQILVRTSGLFSRLNEEQLREIMIPVPSTNEQITIKNTRAKAESMRQEAVGIEKEALAKILKKFD